MENRTCAFGLEEREVGSLRDVIWLFVPYMLAGERCEEMDWGRDMPDQDPHIVAADDSAYSIAGRMFSKVQLAAGRQDPHGDVSSSPSRRDAKQFTHPGGMSYCKFQ